MAPAAPSRAPDGWGGWRGPAALLVALACYLYGLDAPDIPGIGDEPLYLQIVRVTGESGRLLPLRAESGILDTKPPLLFWLGLASTGGGADLALWRLRLPVVLLTFAAAGLAGWLAARLARHAGAGWLAALLYLGFRSTLQHGRPFLTNAGEVLFVLLPLALALARPTGAGLALACGLSLGAAGLFKSFFLVVPATVGLALALARRDGAAALLRRHAGFLAGSAALGLALFGLWPLLDPHPELVWSQFVVGENGGKLRPERFLAGLVSGPYPLWRIWAGPLLDAGLLAPPLLALGLDAWRRRRALPAGEGALWGWVLGFLVVYSLPTQRQENYLLPACAALAALLAVRWRELPAAWLRWPLGLLGVAALALLAVLPRLAGAVGRPLHSPWLLGASALLGLLALAAALRPGLAHAALPPLAVLALPLVTGFMAPFNAGFPPAVAAGLAGARVSAPDRFAQDQELLRFRLPGAALARYACPSGPVRCPPPAPDAPALAYLDLGEPTPPGWEVIAEVPHLRMRHSPAEVARLLSGEAGLLVERLALLEPDPQARTSRSR